MNGYDYNPESFQLSQLDLIAISETENLNQSSDIPIDDRVAVIRLSNYKNHFSLH